MEGEGRTAMLPAGGVSLEGCVRVPAGARGVVILAYGSSGNRLSPASRKAAAILTEAGLATLILDLLTADEDRRDRVTARLRFDVRLLAERLIAAVEWLGALRETAGLGIGCFGAGTGAAAALVGAAERPGAVQAVVSCGGHLDLARDILPRVGAPTLLIVAGQDTHGLALNRAALSALGTEKRLEVVVGASHLFQEPGVLERVAEFAAEWFVDFLREHPARPPAL